MGNIQATIQGEKNGESEISLLSMQDYYPFGSPMPGRSIANTAAYQQGYQGQQLDPETGFNAFELRLYDSRLGGWLSPDPYRQHLSPYMAMSNNPFSFIDPDGGYDEDGNPPPTYDDIANTCPTCTVNEIFEMYQSARQYGFVNPELLQQISTSYKKTGEHEERVYSENNSSVYIFTVHEYSSFSNMKINNVTTDNLDQEGQGGDGTFWSSTTNVLSFLLGVGPSIKFYGPDSDESKAMNYSPGVDQAVALYYKKGKEVKGIYEFSPNWENGKLVNLDVNWTRHKAANSPVRFVTGGYTYWVSGATDGSLNIMIGNQMSANSLLFHMGNYFGVNINYPRIPSGMPQPLSNTYQFFLINRPGK